MDKKKEEFIEELKKSYAIRVHEFALNFDETKSNIICKILTTPLTLTTTDKTLISNKYFYDEDVSKALLTSSQTDFKTKESIVDNFINHKIKSNDCYFTRNMIETIFTHYADIHPSQLKSLFFSFYYESVAVLQNKKFNPPHIDKLHGEFIQFYLNVINELCPQPKQFYHTGTPVFDNFKQSNFYDLIIDHLPNDTDKCLDIATGLINNQNLSDNQRNWVFDNLPYSERQLKNITPYITEALYNSAITMYELDATKELMESNHAIGFITDALMENQFPESIQIDLAHRIIFDDKKHNVRSSNIILEILTQWTKHPKVLDIIFDDAKHVNNRDAVCYSQWVSNETLQKQANIYYKKIAKKIKENKSEKISNKWFDELSNVIKKTSLTTEMYDFLVKTQNIETLKAMCESAYTPKDIIKQINDIPLTHASEKNPSWLSLLTHCLVRQKIEELGVKVFPNIKYCANILNAALHSYRNGNNFYTFRINSGIHNCDRELMESLPEIFNKLFDIAEHDTSIIERETFSKKFNKKIKEAMDVKYNFEAIEDTVLKRHCLLDKMSDVCRVCSELISKGDVSCYIKLDDFAKEYANFKEEYERLSEVSPSSQKDQNINSPEQSNSINSTQIKDIDELIY